MRIEDIYSGEFTPLRYVPGEILVGSPAMVAEEAEMLTVPVKEGQWIAHAMVSSNKSSELNGKVSFLCITHTSFFFPESDAPKGLTYSEIGSVNTGEGSAVGFFTRIIETETDTEKPSAEDFVRDMNLIRFAEFSEGAFGFYCEAGRGKGNYPVMVGRDASTGEISQVKIYF